MVTARDSLIEYSNSIRRQASNKINLLAPPQEFMESILREALEAMQVSRISIWKLKQLEGEKAIVCVVSTDWFNDGTPNDFPVLSRKDFPLYFSAIELGHSIVAHNAESDERTREFVSTYLRPQNIKSLLDTIIFQDGAPCGVICCEQKGKPRFWTRDEVHFAEVIADCCTYRFMARRQAEFEDKLERMVFEDELTKVHNRRFFFDSIDKIFALHKRNQSFLTLAIIDLDDFKMINDKYGHFVGDSVLKKFAEITKSELRNEDIFCRYGGEEFVIIFQGIDVAEATVALKRVLESVFKHPILSNNNSVYFSFSAGVSTVNYSLPFEISLKNADRALYRAKALGKKRVEIYDPHKDPI